MFRGIPTARVEALVKGCSQRWVKKGHVLYRKRAAPNACYFLQSGKVKLFLLLADGETTVRLGMRKGQIAARIGVPRKRSPAYSGNGPTRA